MRPIVRIAIALALVLSATQSASAALSHSIFSYSHDPNFQTTLQLTTSSGTTTHVQVDRGWYNEVGFHQPTNPNYIAGFNGSDDENQGDNLEYRNWFVFRIPQLGTSDVYSAASLSLWVPTPQGYISPQPDLTYRLWDVTTDPDSLAAGTAGVAGFVDLGSGIEYGATTVTEASEGTLITIQLNSNALASLNTPLHSFWGIGGAVQLVPEPSSLVLATLAVVGLAVARFRRRPR